MLRPFHLAFPIRSLDETRRFYAEVLGCGLGRSGDDWVDINFFGSQIVAHVSEAGALAPAGSNVIDGNEVPLPHFGAVLNMDEWRESAGRLQRAGVEFVIEPHVRYEGQPHEQASMIFRDPSGNVLELKAMDDPTRLFES